MGRKTNAVALVLGILMFASVAAASNPAAGLVGALLVGGGLWLVVNGAGSWLRGGQETSEG